MQQYLELMARIAETGDVKTDRTGTGTTSVFGHLMRFNLKEGFPLVTTKKVHTKSIIHELIWFLNGDTNIKYLQDNGVRIWDEWADANGNLGPVYGAQWRKWTSLKLIPVSDADECTRLEKQGYQLVDSLYDEGAHKVLYRNSIDQIATVVDTLKNQADSRRIIVSAWNVAELPDMKLSPCHALFQFYAVDLTNSERNWLWQETHNTPVRMDIAFPWEDDYLDKVGIPRQKLSCLLYQRSADVFLGVPFNIASYAMLTHMIAQQVNMDLGEFIWVGGDCHLYSTHKQQVELQLSRDTYPLSKLVLKRKPESIFDYKFEDFEVVDYQHHAGIKAPVAV